MFVEEEIYEGNPRSDIETVFVKGVINDFGFHKQRLEEKRADIASMLDQLDDSFKTDSGGGMTFLNACMTKSGVQWGEHPSMEMLFVLGIGLGLCNFPLPRELWSALYGGMPYVQIDSAALRAAQKEVTDGALPL